MKRLGIALAVLVCVGLSGCGSSTLTAQGTMALVATDAATDDCSTGTGGYSDIHNGAEVVIYDASSKKLAVGALKTGKKHRTGYCTWRFSIPDIPQGKGPYGVEIASRGEVSFMEKDASSIVVTLGS